MAATAGSQDFGDLPKKVDYVEFKHTLAPPDEATACAIFRDALKHPQRRKVYFYDTRELDLYNNDNRLVLRARVTQGDDDDSTVKLRPATLDADAPWREVGGVGIEADVGREGLKYAAKLDDKPKKRGEIEDVEKELRKIRTLFSSTQRDLVTAYAPKGVRFKDLQVLGPVDARKWVFDDLDGYPYELCIEEWSLPDTTRFIELSTKVKRKKAESAGAAFDAVLERIGVKVGESRGEKTPIVLRFFADRLP